MIVKKDMEVGTLLKALLFLICCTHIPSSSICHDAFSPHSTIIPFTGAGGTVFGEVERSSGRHPLAYQS